MTQRPVDLGCAAKSEWSNREVSLMIKFYDSNTLPRRERALHVERLKDEAALALSET